MKRETLAERLRRERVPEEVLEEAIKKPRETEFWNFNPLNDLRIIASHSEDTKHVKSDGHIIRDICSRLKEIEEHYPLRENSRIPEIRADDYLLERVNEFSLIYYALTEGYVPKSIVGFVSLPLVDGLVEDKAPEFMDGFKRRLDRETKDHILRDVAYIVDQLITIAKKGNGYPYPDVVSDFPFAQYKIGDIPLDNTQGAFVAQMGKLFALNYALNYGHIPEEIAPTSPPEYLHDIIMCKKR